MAYGGNITATVTVDISKASAALKTIVAEANNMGKAAATSGAGVNNLQKGIDNTARSAQNAAGKTQQLMNNIKGFGSAAQGANSGFSSLTRNVQSFGNAVSSNYGKTVSFSSSLGIMGSAAQRATATGASGFQRLGEGISKAGQGLNQFASSFVSFDIWMAGLVGGAFLNFTVGAAAAVDRSLQLMKFVGMSSAEVERLNKSTKDYAKSAAMVSQPEMLDAWRIVRLSAKMSGDQMIANNGTMGDTIALYKMQGRSATDAGRAVEDAMSGNFMRFKEINIKQSDLIKAGWDGNRNNAEGFFKALQKIYADRGIVGLANNTESVAAKFENVKEQVQLIGVAIGQQLLPVVSALLETVLDLLKSPLGNALVGWTISATALGFTFALLLPVFGNLIMAIPKAVAGIAVWRNASLLAEGATLTNTKALSIFGGALSGIGGSIKSAIPSFMLLRGSLLLSLGVWGAVAIAIGVAAYALYDYGNKQGWFVGTIKGAKKDLADWKAGIDAAKTAQQNAQQEVDNWTAKVKAAKPGTDEYKIATEGLAQAKRHLESATKGAEGAEEGYQGAVSKHDEVMKNYADAQLRAANANVYFKMVVQGMSAAEAQQTINTAAATAGLNEKDKATVGATGNLNNYADRTNTVAEAYKNANETGGPFSSVLGTIYDISFKMQNVEPGDWLMWWATAWRTFGDSGPVLNIQNIFDIASDIANLRAPTFFVTLGYWAGRFLEWATGLKGFNFEIALLLTNANAVVGHFLDLGKASPNWKPWVDFLLQFIGLTQSKSWDDFVKILTNILHIIYGTSPGIIPGLQWIMNMGASVWSGLISGAQWLSDKLKPIKDILDKITQFKMPGFSLGGIGQSIMDTVNNLNPLKGLNLSNLIPNLGTFHLPTPEQVLGLINDKLKIFGSFNIFQLGQQALSWVQQKVGQIVGSFNINNLAGQAIGWVQWRIGQIFGGFNIGALANWAGSEAIRRVHGIFGTFNIGDLANQAIRWVKNKIDGLNISWPFGPGRNTVSSTINQGVSSARSAYNTVAKSPIGSAASFLRHAFLPGGPWVGFGASAGGSSLRDQTALRFATRSGVPYNNVRAAANKKYSGMGAFTDIANGIASRLHYTLYMNNPKSDQAVWSSKGTNCMDGAEFLINEANSRMHHRGGLSGSMSPSVRWGGWPHRYAVISGRGFDMANKLLHGDWTPHIDKPGRVAYRAGGGSSAMVGLSLPHGPGEDFDYFMNNIGSALNYMSYGGHAINPYDALLSGGNCFDMTLGIMNVASQLFGLPAKMVWGTYGGNSHVWANLGGKDYDLSRRALEGTYSPPPRGPGGGAGTVIIIEGDVYGYKDFADKVEKVANGIFNNSW